MILLAALFLSFAAHESANIFISRYDDDDVLFTRPRQFKIFIHVFVRSKVQSKSTTCIGRRLGPYFGTYQVNIK